MAGTEHPEKYGWWLNELDSPGINTQGKNGLNNRKEASDLTAAVKQTLYEDYLQAIVKVIDNQETGFSKDFGTVFLIKISLNHKVTPEMPCL